MSEPLRKELLEILACPKCKHPLKQAGDTLQCQAPECRLRYPLRNGIPVMLIEEAKQPPLVSCPPSPHLL